MNEPKVIMYDDPALVEPVKVEAFKGADGNTYMSESAARWNCCTHVKCDNCGGQAPRGWILCDNCREAVQIDLYNQYGVQQWDWKTPLYSESHERYFFNECELDDYCVENQLPIRSLRVVICKPIYLSRVDADYWEDELPELGDGGPCDLPDPIQEALNKLNEVISNHKEPVAWEPSKIAAIIDTQSW